MGDHFRKKVFNVPLYFTEVVFIDTDSNERLEKDYNIDLDTAPYAHTWHQTRQGHREGVMVNYIALILNTKSDAGNI